MLELNVAQVIGYSVQVLLLLALLVALSIRSWPFLIAIVFMGLFALTLACVRASQTKQTTHESQPGAQLMSGHRELDDIHEDYGSARFTPDPPLAVDSLDNGPVRKRGDSQTISHGPTNTRQISTPF